MSDAWTFGWTQVLTLVGFLITIVIAIGGFQSFNRWKRQRIEERLIDIAFEGLSLAQEAKYIFGRVRDPNGFEAEWHAMPIKKGESAEDRAMRGGTYAILVRLQAAGEFFERIARFQPKAAAVFGKQAEAAFAHLHTARQLVHDAAVELTWRLPVHPDKPNEEDFNYRMRLRGDLWESFGKDDRVAKEVSAFQSEMEAIFRPVIRQGFQSWRVAR